MCNTAPGPRCAGHLKPMIAKASARRAAAVTGGDPMAVAAATAERAALRFDYHGTRTGQKELAAFIAAEAEPADRVILENVKRDALTAYKAKKVAAKAAAAALVAADAAPKVAADAAPKAAPKAAPQPPARPAITEFNRYSAMVELRRRDIARVEVHFSGGNDEGGADGITAFRHDGTTTELAGKHDVHQDYKTKKHMIYTYGPGGSGTREATNDEITDAALAAALEAPVDESYSFGGSGYVNGTFTWDVDSGKVSQTDYNEEPSNYDDEDDRW